MSDELIDQMKRWGNATVARYAANDDGPSAGDSVLARTTDFGMRYKRKRDDEHQPVGRDGEERRRFMAARSGVRGMIVTPMWACDPVRATNDADAPHDRPAARVDIGIPDDLRWIETALIKLSRQYPLRALILREEFTGQGSQNVKAKRVQAKYAGALSKDQYRRELARALDWMRWSRAA
jgi:hypothetical protein